MCNYYISIETCERTSTLSARSPRWGSRLPYQTDASSSGHRTYHVVGFSTSQSRSPLPACLLSTQVCYKIQVLASSYVVGSSKTGDVIRDFPTHNILKWEEHYPNLSLLGLHNTHNVRLPVQGGWILNCNYYPGQMVLTCNNTHKYIHDQTTHRSWHWRIKQHSVFSVR
jgi:hypothetical protein